MSIQSEIDRIKGNVSASYAAVESKGGLVPETQISDNLAAAINSIPAGSGGDVTLDSISITSQPNNLVYLPGDVFNPTGMSVWASFSNGYGLYVNPSDLAFDPAGPLEEGVESVTVRFSWGSETAETSQPIEVTNVRIFGVEWDWTSGGPTRGTRTDAAANFIDPVPAVNNGTGSSPFDNLMPWSGMVKETRAGGVEVKEPKYWFKWTKTGKKLKLQIADGPVEGFHVDPVNMDRGDGLGELDFSYIGRYHCGSDYKSTTNVAQKVNIARSAARTGIHGLGANFWQMDFAQFWYVGMLYLVEFADWNGQATIGYGCSASGSKVNNGATDAMQYHTGTTAANRNIYGFTQYRNIEGWWDNVFDWMDGCYYNSNGLNVILNPNQFSDSANGTLIGSMPSGGYPNDMAIPTQSGFEWALRPATTNGSDSTYVSDGWYFSSSSPNILHGGYYRNYLYHGPFYVSYIGAGASADISCRLQERPPKATA